VAAGEQAAMPAHDRSGLNLIVITHHAVGGRGGWLRLVSLQPLVRRVLDVTNLTRALSIHATTDDAVNAPG
jgi:anti-anti-sigma factor